MTRIDLYERDELRCVDCGEVLPQVLQHAAALRCHDCADVFAAWGVLHKLSGVYAQFFGEAA